MVHIWKYPGLKLGQEKGKLQVNIRTVHSTRLQPLWNSFLLSILPLNVSSWYNIVECIRVSHMFFTDLHFRILIHASPNVLVVWGMYCLQLLEHWDHGFKSHLRCGCVPMFVCVVLSCVGRGLVSSDQSPVQGALSTVQIDW
jgi:hypothetical protein